MPELQIGYCTNVHAGANLTQTRTNLEQNALAVRALVSPQGSGQVPMGIGLWLSASSARQLLADHLAAEWAQWLASAGLVPYTFNGFPHGDFHQAVVKHQVYLPTWQDPERARYTSDLIQILHALLPAGMSGTISTLPIAWGTPRPEPDSLRQAGMVLQSVAQELQRLEDSTGRHLMLCLEPEPGCVLQRSVDIVEFFEQYLFRSGRQANLRRYLGVCHDVCHAAVMFEDQSEVLRRYHNAGITVGKVQVSSAVRVDFERLNPTDRLRARDQLARFNENRYLHQTCIRNTPEGEVRYYDDLPEALSQAEPRGEWRTHFHVPIYLSAMGALQTTQDAIGECRSTLQTLGLTPAFEVETYAWGVLPVELQQPNLAAGIAAEIAWWNQKNPKSQIPNPK